MAHTDYSTGELNLKLRITSEKNVTIDDVVNEATQIWRESRARKIRFGDTEAAETLMSEVRQKHPEFCKSYPIVHRYICQMQEYSEKTFRLWMKKIQQHPWKNEDEYLAAQADYVAMLFRQKNPRANKTQINNIRANILALLKREHAMFKQYAEESKREVTAEETTLRERSANDLCAFAKLAGPDGMSKAGTIRMETDIQPSTHSDGELIDNLAKNIQPTEAATRVSADNLLS